MTLDPIEELDRLHDRSAVYLSSSLSAIELARLQGDTEKQERLTKRLGVDLGRMLAAADLLGRRRMLLELQDAGVPSDFVEDEERAAARRFAALTPKVPFWEAVGSILGRYPVLARGWRAARDAWSVAGFALARSTTLQVTRNVQQSILRGLRGGQEERAVVTTIQRQLSADGVPATRAYADTVFRTTTSSAYQAGRQAQAQRPGVHRVASGWRYVATHDPDVRDNHMAGDNFVAHVDDPVWRTHSPPNGFQCRCSLEIVTTDEMVKLGLSHADGSVAQFATAPPGFVSDPGFK